MQYQGNIVPLPKIKDMTDDTINSSQASSSDMGDRKSRSQMTIFGNALKVTREFVGLTIYDLEKHGLSHVITNRIEKGKNFTMKSAYKYLDILRLSGAFFYYVYDEKLRWMRDASTAERFGASLKEYRQLKGYSLAYMFVHTELSNNQVIGIEKGKNCSSATLDKYLSVFPDLFIDAALH